MKKQTNNHTPQKKVTPATSDNQAEHTKKTQAKNAAKSIDTANKDAHDVDRKSGM